MATETSTIRRFWVHLSAAAGATDTYVASKNATTRALTVTVHPGASGSAKLEISCRTPDDIKAGNADWVEVEIGGQTAFTAAEGTELPVAIQAVRLTATGAAASARLLGVV